jgi:hypothetical protein
MSKVVQVANTLTGEYDVHKPLPYPFHIDDDGSVLRQDFWRGEPARLLGFQSTQEHRVDLFAHEWLATTDEAPEGWYPVFQDSDGGIWAHAYPVSV